VLLPDLQQEDCEHLLDRLPPRARGRRTRRAGSRSRLSIGTASWPQAGDTMEGLMTRADETMYADKHRQRAAKRVPASARRDVARRNARPPIAGAREPVAAGPSGRGAGATSRFIRVRLLNE
jgi:GGDEF domain-containing protein